MSDCSRKYSHHAAKLVLTQHSNAKNNDPLGISDEMLQMLGNSKINNSLRDMITNATWRVRKKRWKKNYNKLYQNVNICLEFFVDCCEVQSCIYKFSWTRFILFISPYTKKHLIHFVKTVRILATRKKGPVKSSNSHKLLISWLCDHQPTESVDNWNMIDIVHFIAISHLLDNHWDATLRKPQMIRPLNKCITLPFLGLQM